MAISTLTAGATFDTNAGDKSKLVSSPAIGDIGFVFAAATGTTGTFGCSDDSPDGLGAYTKILDVLDASSTNQLTFLVRNAAFASTTAPTVTTTGQTASTGGGLQVIFIRGLPTGRAGANLVRQFGTQANIAAGITPSVNLPVPMLPGNICMSAAVSDSVSILINSLAGWNSFSTVSYSTPPFEMSGQSLTVGWIGTTLAWANNTGNTMAAALVELDLGSSVSVIANPDLSQFPRGGNR